MLQIHIVTIFPKMFESPFAESIVKRAVTAGHAAIKIYNLRDYTNDPRKTVDDKPFGGGPGMIMKVEPFYKAIKDIKSKNTGSMKILLTSAKGKKFNQSKAEEFSNLNHLVILCGHYEGVDERVAEHLIDEEISIGDYVLTGGEIPAMVISDAVIRLIPNVLGNEESLIEESFNDNLNAEYPQYTRPAQFTTEEGEIWEAPTVLSSGNHALIAEWKEASSVQPDANS